MPARLIVYILDLMEENSGKVPIVKHEMASELRVGWNANHKRPLGLLDRMIVHVDKRRI
jgi:hypothetical protein